MAGAVSRVWVKRRVEERRVSELSRSMALHPRVARLLVARGIEQQEHAERYLRPTLSQIPDPFSMKHVARAAERLADAIARKERITLYGDYDVDGVTSSALLASFLRHHGVEPSIYIPKRLVEGYGLNAEAIDRIAERGTQLLVTLDCGITAADEIARANERAIQTIVVDHHRCPPALPPAYATLNPHQDDCGYPEKVLAAVGVSFNLIVATRKVLRDRGAYGAGEGQHPEPNLRRFLDLVALGTVADMVPLTGVNRVLTSFGIAELQEARRPGVRALMDASGVSPRRVGSSDLGFRLGPRINAAGRLDDASVGVRLLLVEDMNEARHLAEVLDAANSNRQRIEADVFKAAVEQVDGMGELPRALVLAHPDWHPGVVGIVASKLVERYDRATVLIGEGGRGSARTARGIHLYDALADVAHHLTKFGGHRAAAGLRIASEKIEQFRADFILRVAADEDAGRTEEAQLVYDDDLHPDDVDERFYRELRQLEPFGNGNPEPLFRVSGCRVKSAQVVGGGAHLKLRLEEGRRGGLRAIAFKRGDLFEAMVPGREVDLTAHLERNEFQGFESIELRVRDVRALDALLEASPPAEGLAQLTSR